MGTKLVLILVLALLAVAVGVSVPGLLETASNLSVEAQVAVGLGTLLAGIAVTYGVVQILRPQPPM